MAIFPAVTAAWHTGVQVVAKRLRNGPLMNADAINVGRLEDGSPSVEMGQDREQGVRNRFSPGHPVYTPNDGEETPTTTEGTPTPGSGEDSSQADDEDSLKASFVKTTLRRLSTGLGLSIPSQQAAREKEAYNHSRGYHLFIDKKYEEYPEGFPRLAAWLSSDERLEIVRGFKYLYLRLLKQDVVEITELEKDLLEADKHEDANRDPNYRLVHTKREEDGNTKHRELLETIRAKLKGYKELVSDYRELQELGQPEERNFEAYYNWMWNTRPLAKGYDDFIRHKPDLLSLKGHRLNFFDNFIEKHIHTWPISTLEGWLRPRDEQDKTSDRGITYYSQTRRRTLAGGLLVFSTVVTLITPVFVLFLVQMSRVMLCVTTSIFILVFAELLYLATQGDVYQVFVGTAAYSAILVVFLGNISAANGPVGAAN